MKNSFCLMIWCPLKVKPALPARSERGRNGKVGERRRENLKEVDEYDGDECECDRDECECDGDDDDVWFRF